MTVRRSRVDSDTGLTVSYTESGTGPVVVLLHALGRSAADWDGVVADLSRSYRCVAIDFPGLEWLPAISAPVLVVAGSDDDDEEEMERTLQLVPGVERRTIDVGHWINRDAPGRFVGEIRAFLDRHRPDAPTRREDR